MECGFHDLRHTAYAKMAEAGVPEGIIMALMGHVSREMVQRYSHVRMEAMRNAVETLNLGKSKAAAPENRDAVAKDSGKIAKPITLN